VRKKKISGTLHGGTTHRASHLQHLFMAAFNLPQCCSLILRLPHAKIVPALSVVSACGYIGDNGVTVCPPGTVVLLPMVLVLSVRKTHPLGMGKPESEGSHHNSLSITCSQGPSQKKRVTHNGHLPPLSAGSDPKCHET